MAAKLLLTTRLSTAHSGLELPRRSSGESDKLRQWTGGTPQSTSICYPYFRKAMALHRIRIRSSRRYPTAGASPETKLLRTYLRQLPRSNPSGLRVA